MVLRPSPAENISYIPTKPTVRRPAEVCQTVAMQRPVLNPSFLDDEPDPNAGKSWRARLRPVFRLLRVAGRVLFWDPLAQWRMRRLKVEVGTPFSRFCRGVAYRVAFVPLFLALGVVTLVFSGTHPSTAPAAPALVAKGLPVGVERDPASEGTYFEAVTLMSDDGVRLEAWLVPAVDASMVLEQKDKVLRERRAAVVLVHDVGMTRQQMMPLVRPLHDAGLVVLAISLRGCSPSGGSGTTFGLREALDVKAAVVTLRRRGFVDPKRIGIVGVGTGANAALVAANDDPTLETLVLDHPNASGTDVLAAQIGPVSQPLRWMRPLCKWAFEMTYQVDAEDLDLPRYADLMQHRDVLLLDGTKPADHFDSADGIKRISSFLTEKLNAGRQEMRSPASIHL